MKAIVCTKYGSPDVLQLQEVAKPVPKENEVLVKVQATTVTAGDCRMRSFNVPRLFWIPGRLALGVTRPKKPIPGMEFAGVIEDVGKDVSRFKVGDQVYGAAGDDFGVYAEYKCMPEDGPLAIKPANLTYEEAAAVPVGGLTALDFLRKAGIQSGDKVLIYGASGSVGTYAVQVAKYFGAVVTAVCSTTNLEMVKSLGADKVVDYTKEDFTKGDETYDIVFDAVGKISPSSCKGLLKEDGVYIAAVMEPVQGGWHSLTSGFKVIHGSADATAEDLVTLKELIEAGEIRPVIDRNYPLEEIVEAHRYVDSGRKKGNVAITI